MDSSFKEIKMTQSEDQLNQWEPLELYEDCIELRVYTLLQDLSLNIQQQQERILKIRVLLQDPRKGQD